MTQAEFLFRENGLLISPVVDLAHSLPLPMPAGLQGVVSAAPLHLLQHAYASMTLLRRVTSLPRESPGDICTGVGGGHELMKMWVALA